MNRSRTRYQTAMSDTKIKTLCTTTSGSPVSAPYNTPSVSNSGGTIGSNNQIDDVIHGNYAARKRAGEIIMGPLFLSKWSRTCNSSTLACSAPEWGNENWKWEGDHTIGLEQIINQAGYPNLWGYSSSMESAAIVEAYAKMNKSDIQGGEIMSDLGKTLMMMRNPLKTASTLVYEMARFKKKRLKRHSGNVAKAHSDMWLEHRYGWTPVVSDMRTIILDYEKIRKLPDRTSVIRASKALAETYTKSISSSPGIGAKSSYTYSGTLTSNQRCEVHCGLMVRHSRTSMYESVQNFFGLRAMDVPVTFFNIMPYSFVLDWFIGVGDWIQACVPNPSVTILGSWATSITKLENTFSGSVTKKLTPLGSTGSASLSSLVKHETVTRRLNPSLPTHPVAKVGRLPLRNVVDSIALLVRPVRDALRRL